MWKDILKNTVLKPLLARVGTIAATYLVVGGNWACAHWDACGLVTQAGAEQVVTYVVAVILLCGDLLSQRILEKTSK
jgi:hypothetical protein